MKPKSEIWKFFLEKTCNNKTMYECKYCCKIYTNKNATKFTRHIKKCMKCPIMLKNKLSEKSNSNSVGSRLARLNSSSGASVNIGCSEQEPESIDLDVDMTEVNEEGNSLSCASSASITMPESKSTKISMSVSKFFDTMNTKEQVFI